VDVRDDSAARDGRLDQSVQLLVTSNGKLQVPGRDTLHLQVLAGVPCKLQHLGGQVLEDGGRVDGGGGTHALAGRHARFEEAVNTSYRELKKGGRYEDS